MKQSFYYILLIVIGLISISSCQKELQTPASIELSEYATIDFNADGGQKKIGVSTNQNTWTASANVEWLDITQYANEFVITSSTNETLKARKGEVLVMGGSATPQRILVEQAASEGGLSLSQDKIDVDQFEAVIEISVNSSGGQWSIEEPLPDWISVSRVAGEDRFSIRISENTEREIRTHKLFVKGNNRSEVIEITQAGKMHFILPLLEPESSSEDILVFEEARKSVLQKDASYMYGLSHKYVTKSHVFRTIKYTFDNNNLLGATITADNAEIIIGEEFLSMLESNGYKYWGDNSVEKVYVKQTQKGSTYYDIVANITYSAVDREHYKQVNFAIHKGQAAPQNTFKELPLGIGRLDLTKQAVAAWESTHGGLMSKSKTEIGDERSDYFYDVNDPTYVTRRYVFDNKSDELLNMHLFFYDINKVFYNAGRGNYRFTREFKKLLDDSGFTDVHRQNDSSKQFEVFYVNPHKKMAISLRVGHYATILDGVPVVHMLVLRFES